MLPTVLDISNWHHRTVSYSFNNTQTQQLSIIVSKASTASRVSEMSALSTMYENVLRFFSVVFSVDNSNNMFMFGAMKTYHRHAHCQQLQVLFHSSRPLPCHGKGCLKWQQYIRKVQTRCTLQTQIDIKLYITYIKKWTFLCRSQRYAMMILFNLPLISAPSHPVIWALVTVYRIREITIAMQCCFVFAYHICTQS